MGEINLYLNGRGTRTGVVEIPVDRDIFKNIEISQYNI